MDSKTIYTKTVKGLGEATGKTSALPRNLRNILKGIDGKASVGALLVKLDDFSEDELQKILQNLVKGDYIREFVHPTENPLPLQRKIAEKEVAKKVVVESLEGESLDFTQQVKLASQSLITDRPKPKSKSQNAPSSRIAKPKQTYQGEDSLVTAAAEIKAAILAKEHTRQQAEEAARHVAEEKVLKEAEAKAQRETEEKARQQAEEAARRAAEEKARREAEEKAHKEAEAKAKWEAEEKARQQAEEVARRAAEEKAQREAEEKARKEAAAQAKREAEEKARQQAEEAARRAAEEKAQREAEEKARHEAEEKARKEAEAKAKREAEEKARQQAEEAARRAAEEKAQREAEEKARREAEEKARKEAEAQAKREAEEKARQQAEEAARHAAEEKSRREAEEKVRREVEEKARKEAEAKAKREAEEKARQQAEEAARRAAEEKAQREAEEKVRREAEEKARKEAETKAKREAEEKARQQAEEAARRAAEEKAQREAEEKARHEAEEKARKEAEVQAQREAEEKSRQQAHQQAEEAARRATEEKARKQAEAKAKEEAEELAQQKAELEIKAVILARKLVRQQTEDPALSKAEGDAIKEEEAKAKREAEEKVRQQAEDVVRQAAEEKARHEAEEKASKEAEAKAKQEAEEQARQAAEEKSRLEAEAEANAEAEAERQAQALRAAASAAKSPRAPINWGKGISTGLVVLIVVGVGLIHVMPFNEQRAQLEKIATDQLQHPVTIKALGFSLVPQPHWRIEGVAIGSEGQIKVTQINALAALDTLFSDFSNGSVFPELQLDTVVLNDEGLGWLLFGKSQQPNLKIAQINAKNIKLESKKIDMPALDAKIGIGEGGNWQKINLESVEKKLDMELLPMANAVKIDFSVGSYAMPFGASLVMDDFHAKGVVTPDALAITEFDGHLYGGTLSGNARLEWKDSWSLSGEMKARLMDAAQLAPGLVEDGKLEGKALYSFRAKDADKLFATQHLDGNFIVRKGTLVGVNFGNMLQSRDNSGGKTSFSEVSGSFAFDNGQTQLRQLKLGAGMITASGNAKVDANKNLHGRFAVNLKSPDLQRSAALALSGTLKEPHFSRQ